MNIIAYGPPSSDKPYIPKIAILEDGSKRTGLGESSDHATESLVTPFDIPDEYWFAILEDGAIETFPVGKAGEWAAQKASDIISRVKTIAGDPLGRLSSLRAAAALVNVPLADLLAAIAHFGEESDSLYDAFIRMRAGHLT